MSEELAGRTALVTGGNKNIGRAIALALADAGADVAVVAGHDLAGAEAVAGEVEGRGRKAFAAAVDLSDADACARLVDDATGALGPIDVLVSNAAHRPLQEFLSITVEDWDRVLRSNLSASFYLARLLLPSMVERQHGRVIAIGGPDGQRPVRDRAHNVTCKAGIIGLMKAISIEFARHGVTANVVTPGMTDTTRNPADYPHWPPTQEVLEARLHNPRLGRPEEIADACAFLAGDKAAYITGQTLHVSGGLFVP